MFKIILFWSSISNKSFRKAYKTQKIPSRHFDCPEWIPDKISDLRYIMREDLVNLEDESEEPLLLLFLHMKESVKNQNLSLRKKEAFLS